MPEINDFYLTRKVESLGSPPDGWRVHSVFREDEYLYFLVLSGPVNQKVLFKITPRNTSVPAHFRTCNFNIAMIESRNVKSQSDLKDVFSYYSKLFEANDPQGISVDNLQSNKESSTAFSAPWEKKSLPGKESALRSFSSFLKPSPEPDFKTDAELLLSKNLSEMTKVLFVSDPYDLKYSNFAPFDRLYFGNECCEHLLPTNEQLEKTLSFSSNANMPLSLVTPFCSDEGIKTVENLISILPPGSEVVFNDYGVLNIIRDRKMIPIHGRLLCHSKKDPRVMSRPESMKYHRTHNIQESYQKFLFSLNVRRIELDNAPQGMDISFINEMSASLYYPFVCSTVTRKCSFYNSSKSSDKYFAASKCGRVCGASQAVLNLENNNILIQGNAHYFTNNKLDAKLLKNGIDRFIYMPVIPNHNRRAEKDICYMDWSYVYENKNLSLLWGAEPEKTLNDIFSDISPSEGAKALDIGCGAGRNFPIFNKWKLKYTGIDISDKAIEKASETAKEHTLIAGDFITYDFRKSKYDLIVDIGCFHTLPPWKRLSYINIVKKLLKKNGFLIIAAWESYDSSAPMYFVMDQIPEWGCSDFDIQELASEKFELLNSKRSPGNNQDFIFWTLKKL